MRTHFIEVTNGPQNWGKFMVGQFTRFEWDARSAVDGGLLLYGRGWDRSHVLIVDLQTGEGAIFHPSPHAMPKADLDKHQIWVCPLFEPFLEWLYCHVIWTHEEPDIRSLPTYVDLPHAPFAMSGYRRPGMSRRSTP